MSIQLFLSELKRRQVYRPVIVYATLAWVLLEGADIVFPRLGFADESVTLVLILVLLGFPVTIYLAWIYDITPDGIFRTQPLASGEHRHFSALRIGEFLLIGALVAVVGYLYLDRLSLQRQIVAPRSPVIAELDAPDPSDYRSIAVLPFDDMSEKGDQVWLAEGIAEELLHALAGIESLKVVARTSSFAFRDSGKTIAEIAEILDVQAILEGSVRRSGERLRITAQLIDAASGYHIWSGSFERNVTDIFDLQDEIARSIVATLRLELEIADKESLIPARTINLEAYNAFIRGRALFDWANPQVLSRSIKYFEMAVAADPNYAEAWGYLAYARGLMALWQSTEQIRLPTTVAYQQALALDPGQSEALTVKGWMKQLTEWDWESAGRLYRQALASMDSPNAMLTYGVFYLPTIDEIPRAIRLLQEAERIDPLQAGFKSNLAMLYIWSGDYEAAIGKAKEALALSPEHLLAQMALVEANMVSGNCDHVLKLVDELPEAIRNETRILGRVGVCYAMLGEEEKAREIYKHIMATTPYHYANLQAALLAISLGEVEDTLDIIEGEIEKRAWTTIFIRIYFGNNELVRKHPRFIAMLERIGLDDQSVSERQGELDI